MTKIRAVINDIDGNLIMTEEPCWRLENTIFERMGLEPMSRDVHRKTWGIRLNEAIAERSGGAADAVRFWQLFPTVYQEFVDSGELDNLTPDRLRILAKIRDMKLCHIVLTSRTAAEMSHLMNPETPLYELVDAFYYKENMTYHKPDPRAFSQIETEHGLKPEECVYVGDQPSDAVAAKGAGLHFVANLEEGLRTEQDFVEYPVDLFINHLNELPDAVRVIQDRLRSS